MYELSLVFKSSHEEMWLIRRGKIIFNITVGRILVKLGMKLTVAGCNESKGMSQYMKSILLLRVIQNLREY